MHTLEVFKIESSLYSQGLSTQKCTGINFAYNIRIRLDIFNMGGFLKARVQYLFKPGYQ